MRRCDREGHAQWLSEPGGKDAMRLKQSDAQGSVCAVYAVCMASVCAAVCFACLYSSCAILYALRSANTRL